MRKMMSKFEMAITISKTTQTLEPGHGDDERKEVIDYGIKELVDHGSPR
jgi:hypothetical protein